MVGVRGPGARGRRPAGHRQDNAPVRHHDVNRRQFDADPVEVQRPAGHNETIFGAVHALQNQRWYPAGGFGVSGGGQAFYDPLHQFVDIFS